MAYDESFAPEPTPAEQPQTSTDAPTPTEQTGADTTTTTDATTAEEEQAGGAAESGAAEGGDETDTTTTGGNEAGEQGSEAAAAGEGAGAAETATTTTDTTPAFNEAEFFKTTLGEGAPATGAELKQRWQELQGKQVTAAQQAQLDLLRDPAKLAEYAQLASQDFDKMDAVEAMRAHFALRFPKLSAAAREHRFQSDFELKYPTLAAALASPDDYAADDPKLLIEKELADADADENRAALKTAQQEKVSQFLAAQPAATPQFTEEQQADMKALPAWLDKTYQDGATVPVDAGEGLKFSIPIPNAAEFKAAFNDTVALFDKFTLTKPLAEGGILNRDNHALATAFLLNPAAFVQAIAKQVRQQLPPAEASIPVTQLTNSSANTRAAAAKAAATKATATAAAESNHSPYVSADDWHHSNV